MEIDQATGHSLRLSSNSFRARRRETSSPMPKHGDGAGRASYVLVLREHDEEGRGYSLELAPVADSDAPPRASTSEETATATGTSTSQTREEARFHALRSTREAATVGGPTARARGDSPSRARDAATGTCTGRRAQGTSQRREEATGGGGAPSWFHGLRSTREAATVAGPAARARGDSPSRAREAATAAGRPPRPRASHARGPGTTVDVAGRDGDGEGGGSDAPDAGCEDIAEAAGEQILRDMRMLLFSQPQNAITREDALNIVDDARPDNRHKNRVHERRVLIPVFLPPKKKGNNDKDDIWNKRQIMYGIALLGLLAFVPAIVAFLPQWALFAFATIWGLSSIGFPCGMYGTYRMERGYSRHMGRLIFMVFCLCVIFMLYQYMTFTGTSTPSSPQSEAISSPPAAATDNSARVDSKWTFAFAFVGVIVVAGHVLSWATGCFTGSDNDNEFEFSGNDDIRTSDLFRSLLSS